MHLKRTMAIVLAVMLLIAGACGPAKPPQPVTPPPPPPDGGTPAAPAPNATPNVTPGDGQPPVIVPPPPPAAVQGPNEVWTAANTFAPGILNVSVGTTVIWKNTDSQVHTVVSNTGLFYGTLSPGDSSNYTFAQAGDYEYNCDIHPGMAGAIRVR